MPTTYNKGEWSELYAFIKLLKDGKIYAGDENANKIDEIYLPIIKIIREEKAGVRRDYFTGDKIKIFENGQELKSVSKTGFEKYIQVMFSRIFRGAKESGNAGAFFIPEAEEIMTELCVEKVKASSKEKVDIEMQIHDINTGYQPEVGFSIKSDVGSAPTLLNPGKNTRFRYLISGISSNGMEQVNAITKETCTEYMKARMNKLFDVSNGIKFDRVIDETYEDNLIMIDSALPEIYGELILQHYRHISEGIYDCSDLIDIVSRENTLGYRRPEIYRHKFKKLLCASALGMTPGKPWDGLESATGGYIIIKKDGDILCYHLYNRNYFETYLISNTRIDRPSATRYDYGYVFEENGQFYIDLNVQVRFKTIG